MSLITSFTRAHNVLIGLQCPDKAEPLCWMANQSMTGGCVGIDVCLSLSTEPTTLQRRTNDEP